MSNHPEVDETVQAVFAAVRAIVVSWQRGDDTGRWRAGTLIDELIERRGQRASRFAAVFLAEVAARGIRNYAEGVGVPVDRVMEQYEQHLLDETGFALMIAEEFPEGWPPSVHDADS